jgi:hypothetical protein
MGFLQAVVGSVFTLLGAASMFFIAYKALVIGNDVAEMKELLKDIRKGARGEAGLSNYPAPLPISNYDSDPLPPAPPEREFVLPTPISRRLDAERSR